MREHEHDVLVIGGGIVGLSVAVHAARRGLAVLLLEAGAEGGVSTQRSGALVRTHYADPSSARLALRGLEHFETFAERYGGDAGFRATGFAYVPTPEEVAGGELERRMAMLQSAGVETRLLDEAQLAAIDPALDVSDPGVVAYEPRSGYADPAAATRTLAQAAVAAGAGVRSRAPVARLLVDSAGVVAGAVLDSGATVVAAQTVLCAGAWSAPLARVAGLDLPIRPTAVKLAFVARAAPQHLTVIDAPGGIYFRPDGEDATLVGRRTWTDEPMDSPDAALPEIDTAFAADARDRLAARLPSATGATIIGGRAGMLDMTPDGLPLVGPSAAGGLWLCCGWSGTGFKTGPAVGEVLAGWLAGDSMAPELAAFAPGRAFAGAAAVVRSPH
jgi:sarcosine oxidase subunit beta